MFFTLSKVIGFFALPTNLLISLGVAGALLLFTRFKRIANWFIVTSTVLLAVASLSPLGNILLLPLEDRFPPWNPSHGPPDGIVVLGGVVTADVSLARGTIALDEGAARLVVTVELARRYPNARIIFSGGSGQLISDTGVEASVAVRELTTLGIASDRIAAEKQSRNTLENAKFSRLMANPQPGQRWLLVTSAAHMPRAMAAFRAAGFPIEAYPVDYRTVGLLDAFRPFAILSIGLRRTDVAVHEWLGLLVYRLSGKTSEIFPAP